MTYKPNSFFLLFLSDVSFRLDIALKNLKREKRYNGFDNKTNNSKQSFT